MANIHKAHNVPPFVRWCSATIPTMFDDSLSYYEALCALNNFIQHNIIEVINNNASVTEEYIRITNELKEYVENYFANLDVQEEINNKLDQMAEAGTLTEIIAQFLGLGALVVFDTVADMVSAEQIINGSKVKTLGKESINDGYGTYYSIGESGDIELNNGLYATLVNDFGGDNYYNEISVTTDRNYSTDYYVTTIPLNDSDGNIIQLSVNEDASNTPITYAEKHYTTITTNAGLTRQNSSSQWKQGAIISNGVALHEDLCDVAPAEYMSYIGFKEDRSVLNFPATATTTTMLAQGVKNAFLTFGQLITNGVKTIPEAWSETAEPRLNIGVKLDGTIIIFACDGRTNHDVGMTMDETADIMLGLGVVNAWRCDGGGSTSLMWKGSKQNRNIDSDGTVDRDVHVTFNVKKETIDKELAKVYSYIGKERQLLNKQIRKDCNSTYEPKRSFMSYANYTTGYNKISDADAEIPLALQASYRHGNGFETIKDSNNRSVGFTCNIIGLVRVIINVGVLCKNTAGKRHVRLDKAFGTTVNNWAQMTEYYTPHADGDLCNITCVVVFNNTVEGTEYHFGAKGQVGDDFNRTYITVEEIGWADS